MPRLIISAAHTLMAPGEIFQDLREADLTRKILAKALPYLDKSGITYQAVPLDLQLMDRIDWINNTGFSEEFGDVFLEIHINDGGKTGVESWYRGEKGPDNKSQAFGEFVTNAICKKMNFTNQGSKSEYEHELGALLILNQSNLIPCAIELLYIDNPEDGKFLRDEQKLDDLAKNLVESISEYLKEEEKKNPQLPKPADTGISTSGSTGGGAPILMDREKRTEMVKEVYKRLMGKEANQKTVGDYVNLGLSEEQLVKKITDSKDHEELVKNALEGEELKGKFKQLEAEVAQTKANLNDLKNMHDSLNKLLQYKNMMISRLQQEMINRGVMKPGEYMDPNAPQTFRPN